MENYKANDKEAIIAYMSGKENVKVEDIIKEAGAEELRVYPIIAELHAEGKLEIVEYGKMGAAEVVKLKG